MANQKNKSKTGKYRYTEQAFDINEVVCVLGHVISRAGMLVVKPIFPDTAVDDELWRPVSKRAWKELVKEPHILLSDVPVHVEEAEVGVLLLCVYNIGWCVW